MGNDAAQIVFSQLRDSLSGTQYSAAAVCAALVTTFAGSLAVVLLVLALWHQLPGLYASKPLLASRIALLQSSPMQNAKGESETSELAPSLRACLRDTWHTTEQEMFERAGFDAVVFLRAVRMMRNIFLGLTIVLLGCAAPVNIVFNIRSPLGRTLTRRDVLVLLTPTLLSGVQLVPHVVLGWVTNLFVFALLWHNYKRVIALRRAALLRNEAVMRVVLLMNLPPSKRSLLGLARVLAQADPRARPLLITAGKQPPQGLPRLIEQYNAQVRRVELTNGEDKAQLAKLADLSREVSTLRTQQKLTELSYGFAQFSSHQEACEVVQHSKRASASLMLAPPPDQLLWRNLRLGAAERRAKQSGMNMLYFLLMIFWIGPNAFIGCFISNLSRLVVVWPAFGAAMDRSRVGFAILQGFLAPSLTIAVFALLPLLFRRMSHLQGKVTRIDREHEVFRKLYAFFFLDNLFIMSLIGVIWDVVAQVFQITGAASRKHQHLTFVEVWNSLRVAERIATAIVNVSSFWVIYLLRAILGEVAGAAQPISLCRRLCTAIRLWGRRSRTKTHREKVDDTLPQPFQYAVQFLAVTFNATIALAFTSIQPLVLPVSLTLFAIALPVKKYELLQVNTTKYESNGLYWPLVCDVALFALAFGNLTLLCIVWVQAGWKVAAAAIPLFATVIAFKVIMQKALYHQFLQPEGSISKADMLFDQVEDKDTTLHDYEDPALIAPLSKPVLSRQDTIAYYKQNFKNQWYPDSNLFSLESEQQHEMAPLGGAPPASAVGNDSNTHLDYMRLCSHKQPYQSLTCESDSDTPSISGTSWSAMHPAVVRPDLHTDEDALLPFDTQYRE